MTYLSKMKVKEESYRLHPTYFTRHVSGHVGILFSKVLLLPVRKKNKKFKKKNAPVGTSKGTIQKHSW